MSDFSLASRPNLSSIASSLAKIAALSAPVAPPAAAVVVVTRTTVAEDEGDDDDGGGVGSGDKILRLGIGDALAPASRLACPEEDPPPPSPPLVISVRGGSDFDEAGLKDEAPGDLLDEEEDSPALPRSSVVCAPTACFSSDNAEATLCI